MEEECWEEGREVLGGRRVSGWIEVVGCGGQGGDFYEGKGVEGIACLYLRKRRSREDVDYCES